MPEEDLPGGSFDACTMQMQEDGHTEQEADQICGALLDESKNDNGNVEELKTALKRGRGLISDVGVDLNSAVDVPAIDSEWVMFKSAEKDGYNVRTQTELVLKADGESEKRISYAPAMIPREVDKEGDVVSTATVENAAHDYLASQGGVDTDHNLVEGKGEVVESWIEPDQREWELPNGETKTYGPGTWMVGIKWDSEPWERIQSGELQGISIYGKAEKVPLGKSVDKALTVPYADEVVVDLVYGAEVAAEKAAEEMGMEATSHEHELDGNTVFMPGPDHETYVETYNELAESGGGDMEASKADDEDPCWEGYTMVGTKPNGDPRCVPSDEVDDAEFSESLTPAETRKRAESPVESTESGETDNTTAQEANKQNQPMTDTESGDSDGEDTSPDVGDLGKQVEALTETVETLKGEIESSETEKQPGDASGALDEATQIIAEMEDVDMAAADIRDQLKELMSVDKEDGVPGEDDDEDEDMDGEGYEDKEQTEKSADDANLAKSGGGGEATTAGIKDNQAGSATNPLDDRASAVEDWGAN